MQNNKQKFEQSGQTLIETLVAAFVLTMGISAALGLAQYSLHATSSIKQRIIAVGLAREGIEAVKNMRDTNWLHETMATDCYNFQSGEYNGAQNANCFRHWLDSYYKIRKGTYYLSFDTSGNPFWQLTNSENYGLDYTEDDVSKGFYQSNGNNVSATNSGFGRAIVISEQNDSPFDKDGDIGPRLKVTSTVWWTDQNCSVSDSIPEGTACKVVLETYLTNWKTFYK